MSVGNSFNYIGRLTRDPELRQVGETSVCRFTLASNNRRGEKEYAMFPDFEVWGKQAETFCKYATKGSQIAVQAAYRENVWEDKDGNRRKTILFGVEQWQFVGNRNHADVSTSDSEPSEIDSEPSVDVLTPNGEDGVPF